jgi:hypothetical protein
MEGEKFMPRYLVERTFQLDFNIPGPGASEHDQLLFIENNAIVGVVWIYSFVSPDRKKSYCIYDAPTPEALRQAAIRNRLPVDRITEVRLLEINPHDHA